MVEKEDEIRWGLRCASAQLIAEICVIRKLVDGQNLQLPTQLLRQSREEGISYRGSVVGT